MRIGRSAAPLALLLILGACTNGPAAPSGPPAAGSTIRYAALGASDTWGYGSSVVCPAYTRCAGGTGYVFVAERQLESEGYTVEVTNHGIPTAVISHRFIDLGAAHGRQTAGSLLEQQLPFVDPGSTLVTIFTGANDVNVITAALGGGAGGADPAAFIDRQVRAFGEDFTALVDGIRTGAPSARIVLLNVPNVGALPLLRGASAAQRQAAQRAATGMTRNVINPLGARGARVVDVMCDARLYQPANLASDGFHPNDAGYALLGNEVARAVTSPSYPPPQSSCAQMSLVP